MKINYPIKYAAMPIIEQVGWSHGMHELEREYDVVYYIVSKCHLISDLTKYKEDGKMLKQYGVVFPYQLGEFGKWQRVVPTYNLIHGYCTNGNMVNEIFDTYEESLNFAASKNEELCEKTYANLPYSNNYAQKIQVKKDEFEKRANEYKLLEHQILLNTKDMKVGNGKELTKTIKFIDNNVRILNVSIYEILRLFGSDRFAIYNISKEQYDNLIKLINEEKIDDIKSVTLPVQGLVLHKEKDDFIKLAIEKTTGAYYIQNDYINYDDKIDKVTSKSFENLDKDVLRFYTTETIDDLLNSYKRYSEINLEEVKGSVLKKVKK